MDHTTLLVVVQLFLDAVLFTLLFLIYRRLKALDPLRTGRILDALQEGKKLCDDLEKNLKEKAALVEELKACIRQGREASPGQQDNRSDRRDEILMLHEKGVDAREISRRTGLPLGEVEVLISLAKTREKA